MDDELLQMVDVAIDVIYGRDIRWFERENLRDELLVKLDPIYNEIYLAAGIAKEEKAKGALL